MKEFIVPFIPVFITAFISAHTPGPNNVLVMQSCVMFGYRKTIPHIMGIILGFCFMTFAINVGLSSLLHTYPKVLTVVKVIGSLYFVWFASKIFIMDPRLISGANISAPKSADVSDEHNTSYTAKKNIPKPFTFLQACVFQWVNVKAWLSVTSMTSVYKANWTVVSIIGIVLIALANAISSTHVWSLLGVFIGRVARHVIIVRMINIIAGTMLLLLGINMWL